MEVLMRTYILAIATAALFAIPTATFAENIYSGPGGVKKGHHRHYNRYEGLYDLYESERCSKSRATCSHKDELIEQGMSNNCRRFRELCD
jgi:hypothetical protein